MGRTSSTVTRLNTKQCLRDVTPTFVLKAIISRSFRRLKRGFIRFSASEEFEFTYSLYDRYMWIRLVPHKEWVGVHMLWHQGRWQHWGIQCPFCFGNAGTLYFLEPTHVRCSSCIKLKSLRTRLNTSIVQHMRQSIRANNFGPIAEALRTGKKLAWEARVAMEFEGLMPALYVPPKKLPPGPKVKLMRKTWRRHYMYHTRRARIRTPRQYKTDYINNKWSYKWTNLERFIDSNSKASSRECESNSKERFTLSEDGVVVLKPECGLGSGLLPTDAFPLSSASPWRGFRVQGGAGKSRAMLSWSSTLKETLLVLGKTGSHNELKKKPTTS